MSSQPEPMTIPGSDPRAIDMLFAIREGDLAKVRRLIAEHPGLERARVLGRDNKGWRTPLHMVADWPGYFPNGPAIVQVLADAGADPNDRGDAPVSETPLHWAASNDDYEVAVALIDAGADIEVPGGTIGTPLANAIGYACWHVARLLVARGAHVHRLWMAAALGDWTSLEALLAADPPPDGDEISHGFWQACHGGQLRVAQYLLAQGGDMNYVPEYAGSASVIDVATATSTRRQALETWLRDIGAAGQPG
jgi:uncharacterized protein